MITRNVTLHLSDRLPVRIPVSQFDSMWQFVFTIINGSTTWNIPNDATATMNGRKPDGNVFAYYGEIVGNTVVVDGDIQMTACAGDTVCELSFMADGKVVGTANFVLAVEEAPKSPEDVSSDSTLPAYAEILEELTGTNGRLLPAGGSSGQVLAKSSGRDYEVAWVNQSGGGSSVEPYTSTPSDLGTAAGSSDKYSRGDHVHKMPTASDIGAYVKPSGGIPASDLASGVIPSVPSASSATPQALGTAAAGSSTDYSRADHVHAKPSAADIGAEPAVTEVAVTTAGAVSQALDAGKMYHFTGALTSLTITLNAASTRLAQYHFDFDSGSTAPTVTLPSGVTMQGGAFTPEANKHYEIDILNGYGVVCEWATS